MPPPVSAAPANEGAVGPRSHHRSSIARRFLPVTPFGELAMRPFALARRLAQAVAAWTGLATFAAGVPLLLVKLAGSPFAGLPPSQAHLASVLRRPLSDHAVMRLLAGGAWLLWAYLAVLVAAE